MSQIYGAVKNGFFTGVHYTEAQLKLPGIIDRLNGMGLQIYAMDDVTRDRRVPTTAELETEVKVVSDLQVEVFERELGISVAQLNTNKIIQSENLPDSIVEYKGTWNADTSSPLLIDGTGNEGDQYVVFTSSEDKLEVDFGSGSIMVENAQTIEYRDGKYGPRTEYTDSKNDTTTSNNLPTEDKELFGKLMENIVDYTIESPLQELLIDKPCIGLLQLKAPNVVRPEFVIYRDAGLLDVTVHPTSGELVVKSANQYPGTYMVDVRVGGSLGRSERFDIKVVIS